MNDEHDRPASAGRVLPLRRKQSCPICRRPATPDQAPFCSRHCADIDLARWFGGAYRIETDEATSSPSDGEDR